MKSSQRSSLLVKPEKIKTFSRCLKQIGGDSPSEDWISAWRGRDFSRKIILVDTDMMIEELLSAFSGSVKEALEAVAAFCPYDGLFKSALENMEQGLMEMRTQLHSGYVKGYVSLSVMVVEGMGAGRR
jgi:hypothetical protein